MRRRLNLIPNDNVLEDAEGEGVCVRAQRGANDVVVVFDAAE